MTFHDSRLRPVAPEPKRLSARSSRSECRGSQDNQHVLVTSNKTPGCQALPNYCGPAAKDTIQITYFKRGKPKKLTTTGIFQIEKAGSLWFSTSSNSNPKRYPDQLRVCRSLVFGRDGYPVSVGLPKFFDISKDHSYREQFGQAIAEGRPWTATVKYDGSLIVRSVIKGRVNFRSRNTMVSHLSHEASLLATPQLEDPSVLPELSLQFEHVTPERTLVIKHEVPELVLIGAVENRTLRVLSYVELEDIAETVGARRVETLPFDPEPRNVNDVISQVAERAGIEGVVIRFDDEKMLRIKTDDYRARHASKVLAGRS